MFMGHTHTPFFQSQKPIPGPIPAPCLLFPPFMCVWDWCQGLVFTVCLFLQAHTPPKTLPDHLWHKFPPPPPPPPIIWVPQNTPRRWPTISGGYIVPAITSGLILEDQGYRLLLLGRSAETRSGGSVPVTVLLHRLACGLSCGHPNTGEEAHHLCGNTVLAATPCTWSGF